MSTEKTPPLPSMDPEDVRSAINHFFDMARSSSWHDMFDQVRRPMATGYVDAEVVNPPDFGMVDDPSIESPGVFQELLTGKNEFEVDNLLDARAGDLMSLQRQQITIHTLCLYYQIFKQHNRGELAAQLEARFQFDANTL